MMEMSNMRLTLTQVVSTALIYVVTRGPENLENQQISKSIYALLHLHLHLSHLADALIQSDLPLRLADCYKALRGTCLSPHMHTVISGL
jgi:hypothetical protein